MNMCTLVHVYGQILIEIINCFAQFFFSSFAKLNENEKKANRTMVAKTQLQTVLLKWNNKCIEMQ